jgi:hypothetical protein
MKGTALTGQPILRAARSVLAFLVSGGSIMARRFYSFAGLENHTAKGVNDQWIITSRSFARGNSDVSPYLIPNEWIATNLASFLRLGVPPCALMRKTKRSKRLFASLQFGSGDAPPRDARPDRCVASLPEVCAGIVVFDILIANSDRHRGNLEVDDENNPTDIYLFDHDRAMFGAHRNHGKSRLRKQLNRLAIAASSAPSDNRHCLIDELTTAVHFGKWIERVSTIPNWFIEEICKDVVGSFISNSLAQCAIDFLKFRKNGVEAIINKNKDQFPQISDWGIAP